MSRTTELAVRKAELKCVRGGRRALSGVALVLALGFGVFAAARIQKYGAEALKNEDKSGGNGLKAVFSMLSGASSGVGEKVNESVLKVISQVENFEERAEVENPFSDACLPVNSSLNSDFGYRTDPFDGGKTVLHRGVDIKADDGTDVRCVLAGTVSEVGYNEIGGNYIRVRHSNGFVTYYGHLQQALVKENDTVEKSQVIALSGHTGNVTGPHLHFQIEYGERYVDPEVFFKFNEE